MNVREAILKAADHIERQPTSYEYVTNSKPDCGTPGCMAGWLGHFLGVEIGGAGVYSEAVAKRLGYKLSTLLDEFGRCDKSGYGYEHQISPLAAAATLRVFADKHYPASEPEHIGIPNSVRAIFAEAITA